MSKPKKHNSENLSQGQISPLLRTFMIKRSEVGIIRIHLKKPSVMTQNYKLVLHGLYNVQHRLIAPQMGTSLVSERSHQ